MKVYVFYKNLQNDLRNSKSWAQCIKVTRKGLINTSVAPRRFLTSADQLDDNFTPTTVRFPGISILPNSGHPGVCDERSRLMMSIPKEGRVNNVCLLLSVTIYSQLWNCYKLTLRVTARHCKNPLKNPRDPLHTLLVHPSCLLNGHHQPRSPITDYRKTTVWKPGNARESKKSCASK